MQEYLDDLSIRSVGQTRRTEVFKRKKRHQYRNDLPNTRKTNSEYDASTQLNLNRSSNTDNDDSLDQLDEDDSHGTMRDLTR